MRVMVSIGRTVAQAVPPRRPGFEPKSGHTGFVVDKAALEQVFSEYCDFPCHSFHRLLHTHHPSSGGGTIVQIVGDVPSGLGLTSPQETKKKIVLLFGLADNPLLLILNYTHLRCCLDPSLLFQTENLAPRGLLLSTCGRFCNLLGVH
jgi:hypothetical protein